MTSVCGLLTWMGISWTYLRFYKGMQLQGIDRNTLCYKAPLQPYLSWYCFIFCGLIRESSPRHLCRFAARPRARRC